MAADDARIFVEIQHTLIELSDTVVAFAAAHDRLRLQLTEQSSGAMVGELLPVARSLYEAVHFGLLPEMLPDSEGGDPPSMAT